MNFSVKTIARSGVIAALYIALCFILKPLSFGMIQLRIAEALCVLPIFMPEAIPGLFIGCFISNLLGGASIAPIDMVLGSLTTLFAAILTRLIYKKTKSILLALLPPVVLNALIVGTYVPLIYTSTASAVSYEICLLSIFSVGIGEAIVLYALGFPLTKAIEKTKLFKS